MNWFQIVTMPVLVGAAFYTIWQCVARRQRRLAIAALFFVGATICVANPTLTSRVAHLLGIGRGADLVAYLTALSIVFVLLFVFRTQRILRLEITELTRRLAIQNARLDLPEDSEPRQDA